VSNSAAEAREMGLLRASDGITMNRDRLLAEAKKVAALGSSRPATSRPRRRRFWSAVGRARFA
jgi:3-hydroxyacyl-CoA dehydrogenase